MASWASASRRRSAGPNSSILARHGDYHGIARGELIDVLTAEGCEVAFDSTVTALTERPDAVLVSLSSAGVQHRLAFDLVISPTACTRHPRPRVGRSARPGSRHQMGRMGGVAPEDADTDLGEELWGAGFFVGMYPVAGELGVFLGGPRADTEAGPAPFVAGVRRRLKTVNPRLDGVLTAVANDPDPYYWSLVDRRAPRWTTGRTALVGDAAAGFLPTAGIGAGMAMESAWVLGRRLLRHADRAA